MTFREISGKRIKRATPDQAETLTQIAFAAKRHWGYPECWIQFWSSLLTITPDIIRDFDTYVAFQGDEPVGFYALSCQDGRASLEHLWILPEYIGKGIGTKLFQHALAHCRALGVTVLEIESDPNAQGFYERMGSRKVGETIGEVDGQPRALPLLEIEI